jgi:hypothetical protein
VLRRPRKIGEEHCHGHAEHNGQAERFNESGAPLSTF